MATDRVGELIDEVSKGDRLLPGVELFKVEHLLGRELRIIHGTGCLGPQPSTFNPQLPRRLWIKHLDLERRQITVRDGKGFKDRVPMGREMAVSSGR